MLRIREVQGADRHGETADRASVIGDVRTYVIAYTEPEGELVLLLPSKSLA